MFALNLQFQPASFSARGPKLPKLQKNQRYDLYWEFKGVSRVVNIGVARRPTKNYKQKIALMKYCSNLYRQLVYLR